MKAISGRATKSLNIGSLLATVPVEDVGVTNGIAKVAVTGTKLDE